MTRPSRRTIYLLHFARPVAHARHYLGSADDLAARLDEHEAGSGPRPRPLARRAHGVLAWLGRRRSWVSQPWAGAPLAACALAAHGPPAFARWLSSVRPAGGRFTRSGMLRAIDRSRGRSLCTLPGHRRSPRDAASRSSRRLRERLCHAAARRQARSLRSLGHTRPRSACAPP